MVPAVLTGPMALGQRRTGVVGTAKRTGTRSASTAKVDPKTKVKAKTKLPSVAVRRACFLEVLRRTANVSRAAREAGLASSSVYGHRARNTGFAADWDAAVAEALDALEEELVNRVRHGVEKPVFYAGQQIGSMRQYSDALAMFILKARRPEVYGRMVAERALAGVADEADEISQEMARAEVLRRIERLRE